MTADMAGIDAGAFEIRREFQLRVDFVARRDLNGIGICVLPQIQPIRRNEDKEVSGAWPAMGKMFRRVRMN